MVPAAAPLPSVLPVLALGATPVLVDNLPGRLGIDPDDLAAKLTARTVAVMSVPLWGYPADVHQITPLLDHLGLPLVEDAAQAHGTLIAGRPAGTLGLVGCFSTHDRKLLATGEGGFIATVDPRVYEAVECFSRLGHLDGSHIGMNLKLAAPLAAIGSRRIGGLGDQLRVRANNAQRILTVLGDDDPISELGYGGGGRPNYYSLVLRAGAAVAAELAETLTSWGLPPDSRRWNYRPLHTRRMFSRWSSPCPNAERLAACTLQLPVHPGLDRTQVGYVARCLRAALDHVRTAP
jgi:perosamine synthetase